MVIHPHYMKRYVHDIRVGQLKGSWPQPLLCVKSSGVSGFIQVCYLDLPFFSNSCFSLLAFYLYTVQCLDEFCIDDLDEEEISIISNKWLSKR